MYMIDGKRKDRYRAKLSHLSKYHSLLQDWLGNKQSDDLVKSANIKDLFSLYHAFQLSMEVIADLTSMVVKDSNFPVQDDYLNLQKLVDIKVIN